MRKYLNKLLRPMGYELSHTKRNPRDVRPSVAAAAQPVPGGPPRFKDPIFDMAFFLREVPSPLIFDIGANEGQSVHRFKSVFPQSIIHAFEPAEKPLFELRRLAQSMADVEVHCRAIGSSKGQRDFLENTESVMSSFLQPDVAAWGEIIHRARVAVDTVDAFAERCGIDVIDILKSDTQGFDMEVLKGAERMLTDGRIGMILMEANFARLYCGQPTTHSLMEHLESRGYRLVAIYEMHYRENLIGWCDLLYIHRSRLRA